MNCNIVITVIPLCYVAVLAASSTSFSVCSHSLTLASSDPEYVDFPISLPFSSLLNTLLSGCRSAHNINWAECSAVTEKGYDSSFNAQFTGERAQCVNM